MVFDHCNSLSRPGGCEAHGWHTHAYPDRPEEHPGVGFVRIFLYRPGPARAFKRPHGFP